MFFVGTTNEALHDKISLIAKWNKECNFLYSVHIKDDKSKDHTVESTSTGQPGKRNSGIDSELPNLHHYYDKDQFGLLLFSKTFIRLLLFSFILLILFSNFLRKKLSKIYVDSEDFVPYRENVRFKSKPWVSWKNYETWQVWKIHLTCYNFPDSTRFMAIFLSNFVNNFSEGIHRIKCKYEHDHRKYETCGIKYKFCKCFLG